MSIQMKSSFSLELFCGEEAITIRGTMDNKAALLQKVSDAFEMLSKSSGSPGSYSLPANFYFNANCSPPESKIASIKRIREITNCGLREGKDWIEGYSSIWLDVRQIQTCLDFWGPDCLRLKNA
jgi:hypothetical protein